MRSRARTTYDPVAPALRPPRSSRRRGTRAVPAMLRGRVLDAVTGAPIAGASLTLVFAGRAAARRSPVAPRTSTTNACGGFEIARAAGPGVLLVRRAGYLPEIAPVAPRRGDVSVRLARAGAVHGELTGPDGAPLAGVRVIALSPSAMDVREGRTGADGRFHIDGLRPGRYVVKPLDAARSPRVAPAVAEVRAGEVALASLRSGARPAPPASLEVA